MKRLLLVTVFGLFACLSNAQENATETTYYQKVPRLVKQADGSYKPTDEYYFVPVEKEKNPVASTQLREAKATDEERAEKEHPYLSLGVSYAKAKAHAKAEFAGDTEEGTLFKDWQPAFKGAFGSQINPYLRVEVFYQYRTKIQESDYDGGYVTIMGAKMQDIGLNAFLTVNPASTQARLFVGAGLAATRVKPIWKTNGIDISKVLWDNDYFVTPTGFIGIEWPDENNKTVMDITAFYSKTFINKGFNSGGMDFKVKDIVSYGVQLNFRFNL